MGLLWVFDAGNPAPQAIGRMEFSIERSFRTFGISSFPTLSTWPCLAGNGRSGKGHES